MLLLRIAGTVRGAGGRALHQVDVKTLDANALFRQTLTECRQIAHERRPGCLRFRFHAGHHHAILHADLQTQRAEFRRAEPQADFPVPLLGRKEGFGHATEKACAVDGHRRGVMALWSFGPSENMLRQAVGSRSRSCYRMRDGLWRLWGVFRGGSSIGRRQRRSGVLDFLARENLGGGRLWGRYVLCVWCPFIVLAGVLFFAAIAARLRRLDFLSRQLAFDDCYGIRDRGRILTGLRQGKRAVSMNRGRILAGRNCRFAGDAYFRKFQFRGMGGLDAFVHGNRTSIRSWLAR